MKKSVKLLSSLFALFFVGFAAVSCTAGGGKATSSSVEPAGTTTSTTDPDTLLMRYLTFIGDNQFRVDVMDDDLGVTFKYNNTAITNKQSISYVTGGALTIEGDCAYDDLSFIFVSDTPTSSSVFYAPEVTKENLTQYLNSTVNDDLVAGTKVYLAVFHGKTAKWTKNLNADMDTAVSRATSLTQTTA